jgi:hypothetical protein
MRVKQTPERGFERIQMQLTRFSAYHTGLYNFLLLVHHVFHVVNSEKVKLYSARDPGYLIMPLPSYGLSCGIYSSMATCAVFSTAIALRLLTNQDPFTPTLFKKTYHGGNECVSSMRRR